jgi:hypothetical protein
MQPGCAAFRGLYRDARIPIRRGSQIWLEFLGIHIRLFVAQGFDRIKAGGATCRKPDGKEGHYEEKTRRN